MSGDCARVSPLDSRKYATLKTIVVIPGLESVPFLHAGNWLDRPQRPDHLLMQDRRGEAADVDLHERRHGRILGHHVLVDVRERCRTRSAGK